MNSDRTRYGLLDAVLKSYFVRSRTLLGPDEIIALALAIKNIADRSCPQIEDFKPESFNEVMSGKKLSVSREAVFRSLELYEQYSGNLNFSRISYFGEFLYCCSTSFRECNFSNIKFTRMLSSEGKLLITEISKFTEPDFGLMIFVLYRSWSLSFINKTLHLSPLRYVLTNQTELDEVYPYVLNSYTKLVETVLQNPCISEYFGNFQRYLCGPDSPYYVVGNRVIDFDYLECLQDLGTFNVSENEASFVYVLMYVLDILLFLFEASNFKNLDFSNIPKYLDSKMAATDLKALIVKLRETSESIPHIHSISFKSFEGYQSVNAMLLAISHVTDFAFLDDYGNRERTLSCLSVWKKLNGTINLLPAPIQYFVYHYSLFPFFEYKM